MHMWSSSQMWTGQAEGGEGGAEVHGSEGNDEKLQYTWIVTR